MDHEAPARVSVIVPTRGRPALLREALASIRAVERSDLSLEILVCDNGGGSAADIAREFGATYLTVKQAGAAAARNAGLRAATGDFVAFLDDDDLWLPGHLRPHLALLAARPDLSAVVGRTITTDDARTPTSDPWPVTIPNDGDVFHAFLREYPQIGATVARTSVRDSVGLLDPDLLSDEDWEWHLRLALKHRVGFVPEPCVMFRQRPAGTFDDLQWMRLRYMTRVFVRAIAQSGSRRPGALQIVRLFLHHRWGYHTYFLTSAVTQSGEGRRFYGWRALVCAIWSSPTHTVLGMVRGDPRWKQFAMLALGRPSRRIPDRSSPLSRACSHQPLPHENRLMPVRSDGEGARMPTIMMRLIRPSNFPNAVSMPHVGVRATTMIGR